MLDYQKNLKSQFDRQGYIIFSKLFDSEKIDYLKSICDRVLMRRREEYLKTHPKFHKKNCDVLQQIQYLSDRFQISNCLLNTIADEQVLSVLDCICNRQLLFHGMVYFLNPEEGSWRGDWHRDGQINAPNDNTERSRIFNSDFIRVHIALIADNNLEIVAGSHARWDTPQELEIRKGLNGKSPNSDRMPFATTINLQPGDTIFFDGYSIHRGNYFAERSRKTLAMLYSSPVDWETPPDTCFFDPDLLKNLSPQQREILP